MKQGPKNMATYDSVKHFARYILDRYQEVMDEDAYWATCDDLAAGEFEVAAISAVEMAPVTAAEVDAFEVLAREFYGIDAKIAQRVIAKIRQRQPQPDACDD